MDDNKTIRAIIVDDESRHHETLGKMLNTFCPEIELCGNANSVKEAVDIINSNQPQLVFLDIEMPGGN